MMHSFVIGLSRTEDLVLTLHVLVSPFLSLNTPSTLPICQLFLGTVVSMIITLITQLLHSSLSVVIDFVIEGSLAILFSIVTKTLETGTVRVSNVFSHRCLTSQTVLEPLMVFLLDWSTYWESMATYHLGRSKLW